MKTSMPATDPGRRRFPARALWIALSLGLAAVIGVLTLLPQPPMPKGPQGIDKLYHVLAFAALAFPTGLLQPRMLILVAPLAMLYGGIIEVIQPIFGRTADLNDLMADGTGILTGIVLGLVLRRWLPPRDLT